MKKYLRILTLLTLGTYLSLVVTEIFHNFCRNHVESKCVICQVIHQTPVITQGRQTYHQQENYSRLVSIVIPFVFAATRSIYHGRSPPLL